MANLFIAVDLETTGLDPARDSIIEVAAIKFRNGQILDEWSSLVNPYSPIPPFITKLTGIDQSMVDDANDLFTLRSEIEEKLADGILVGHNVGFDLGFLNAENLALGSHKADTSVLASILLPTRGRYGLSSLSRFLDLREPGDERDHRALGDARRTFRLFTALQERAGELDFNILEELVRAGQRLRWPETVFFEEAWRQAGKEAFGKQGRRGRRQPVLRKLYQPARIAGSALAPGDEPSELDTELISGMLEPGGVFEKQFPGYEHRPQQVNMIKAVSEAFNQGQHLMIEAGTGIGKSIGYLLPAAFWSNLNQRRVVVSTNTINLQDQLINKDLPELDKLAPFEIRSAVLKGRRNYLCTRLFQQLRHRGPGSAEEMALYGRILVWLPDSESGDLAEISLRSAGERLAWDRINSENEACTAEKCAAEGCPLHQARRQAEIAHVLVVNHALLLADVASLTALIMDEAHHLESAITSGLSFRCDRRFIESLLDEITRARSGILASIRRLIGESLPAEVNSVLQSRINSIEEEVRNGGTRLWDFFSTLEFFLDQFIDKDGQYSQQIRITAGLRNQPDYDQVLISFDNLDLSLMQISNGLAKLAGQIADVSDSFDLADGEDIRLALISLSRNLSETQQNISAIISEPNEGMIYWAEIFKSRLSLHAAPLHIGSLVEEHIFNAKETVILTSATLRTAAPGYERESNFDYLRSRLHADHVNDLAVGSPFDYKNSTLLLLPTDMPEPNQPGYQRCVEQAIAAVAQGVGGRTLALFTSYSQLNKTAEAIEPGLQVQGIGLLSQSAGASRRRLLEQFRAQESPSILLGTRSFWEGIDVPGSALQAVVIVRLPFDVPSDPIVAARSETFENPFFEYTIPEAVLRFRQGFGRLIRRQDDEGLVLVLDKRVLTKRYGQAFLDALPECTVLRQRLDRIEEISQRWLNRDR